MIGPILPIMKNQNRWTRLLLVVLLPYTAPIDELNNTTFLALFKLTISIETAFSFASASDLRKRKLKGRLLRV